MSALDKQVGGDHYKGRGIQPVEYIHSNNLDFFQGAVVKYITRWRDKDGLKDLEKCKHFLEMYIELESKKTAPRPGEIQEVLTDADVREAKDGTFIPIGKNRWVRKE
jgi:hypothetical protein